MQPVQNNKKTELFIMAQDGLRLFAGPVAT